MYLWPVAYLATIVLVNWLFVVLPMMPLFGGEVEFPLASLVVGAIFIFRDLAQRQIGHWVILVMLAGGALSWWLADPYVAVASVTAFLISESLDWIVYSVMRRPLRDRMVASSLVSTPIDSAVFLAMIGAFSWLAVVVMTISKMAALLLPWWRIRAEEVA